VIEIFTGIFSILSAAYFITLLFFRNTLTKLSAPCEKHFNDQKHLSISVIVCARNEEPNLPELIHCLKVQNIDGLEVEFILVNDRSEDGTKNLIDKTVEEDNHFKAVHIMERIAGFAPKKRAIETAVKSAAGDIILLTDADGRPQKEWVKKIATYFNKGADMVIGYAPYSVGENDNIIKKVLALEYFSIASIAAATTASGFPVTCVGTNMAYRKKMYEEIGGFGEYKSFISGDDDLLLTRVREAGKYRIVYAADKNTHVYNSPPKTFKQFVNQRLRYASKGFNYPIKVTGILVIYVLYNIFVPLSLYHIVTNISPLSWILFSLITFKFFIEYSFLLKAADILWDKRFLHYYPIAAILHIPYILFFGICGQFKIFKWAENKMEYGISNPDRT
jgi:cellulose synthase/poly-beta-1,6-N-acetylglucosamine synthase-like glycosyltransferase